MVTTRSQFIANSTFQNYYIAVPWDDVRTHEGPPDHPRRLPEYAPSIDEWNAYARRVFPSGHQVPHGNYSVLREEVVHHWDAYIDAFCADKTRRRGGDAMEDLWSQIRNAMVTVLLSPPGTIHC